MKSQKGNSGYEPFKKIRKVTAQYDEKKDGYVLTEAELNRAKEDLKASLGSTAASEAKEEPKKDFSQPLVLPKPTKAQCFFGAGVSIPATAIFYLGFLAARKTFLTNPIPAVDGSAADAGGEFFRQAVLTSFWGGSLLALITGLALLVYAFTVAEE